MKNNSTVELGYNDHGYNELMVIANNFNILVWFSIYYQWNFMLIMNNLYDIHGYNEQNFIFYENFIRFSSIVEFYFVRCDSISWPQLVCFQVVQYISTKHKFSYFLHCLPFHDYNKQIFMDPESSL